MDALFSPAFSQSILFCFSILFDYDFRLPAHKSTESEEKDTFLLQSSGAIFFFFGCFTWFRSLYFSIYLKILFPSKLSEERQEEMSWINKWIVFWTMSLKAIHEQTSTPVGKVLAYRVFSPDMSHSLSSARTWGKFKSFYKIWGLEGSQMS